ncbi:hypothetical protein HK103_005633 [Boothiomyces macroporosus]|uniref:Alpha/beta hydrolase fold-3 domain-containing protein n=1 Tax=Boothiomyces macroporosus TaxID=261099 RepID=A0AAD5UHW2_9FUNG|nr:hypothetical protein HK103_005633 [Boothiomyces macroporosus]
MEALFQYIDFEEQIASLNSPNDKGKKYVDAQPVNYYQSVVRIVRTASTLALSTFKKPKKQARKSISEKVFNGVLHGGSLLAHQVKTVASGVSNIVTSSNTRPTWDYVTQFALHFMRENMQYPFHSMNFARSGVETAGLVDLTPSGVLVKTCTFVINKSLLLAYEKRGREYQKNTSTWRYPIPSEDPTTSTAGDFYTLDGEWLFPENENSIKARIFKSFQKSERKRKVIYYIHGGAYILGSAKIYRNLTGILAKNCQYPVFALNYRLAPEHPFPAGLHDVLAGYLWLLDPTNEMFENTSEMVHDPYDPEDIIISGDSAGGGLTMALINYLSMYLRDPDESLLIPFPKACILLSPWVDLSCSTKSWKENSSFDFLPPNTYNLHEPVFSDVTHPVYSYCFGENMDRPLDVLSPTGTVPYRIASQAGEIETLRDESIALAYKYHSQNRDSKTSWVRHELYKDMPHDFQVGSAWLPAARLSIKNFTYFAQSFFECSRGCYDYFEPLELTPSEAELLTMIDSHHDIK